MLLIWFSAIKHTVKIEIYFLFHQLRLISGMRKTCPG